jgi:hypothetical protein
MHAPLPKYVVRTTSVLGSEDPSSHLGTGRRSHIHHRF